MKPTWQRELFSYIWLTRPHESYVSDALIWEPAAHNFAHVLGKGSFINFRILHRNIVLLTYEEHKLWDYGNDELREEYAKKTGADWTPLYNLAAELRELYLSLYNY